MERMPEVVALAKQRGMSLKIAVGGAVVTEAYARSIGADGYGVVLSGRRRELLDEVAADQVEASAASDDLQRLDGRDAADFRRSGAGASRGVDGVDVEGEVDRGLGVGKLVPNVSHQGREGLVPELFYLLVQSP